MSEQVEQNARRKRCPQCGQPIEAAYKAKIIRCDRRAPGGILREEREFCSGRCAGHYQMGCEG